MASSRLTGRGIDCKEKALAPEGIADFGHTANTFAKLRSSSKSLLILPSNCEVLVLCERREPGDEELMDWGEEEPTDAGDEGQIGEEGV
jgi:hypothetical protein